MSALRDIQHQRNLMALGSNDDVKEFCTFPFICLLENISTKFKYNPASWTSKHES
jgi:hypothetical protein